MNYFIAVGIFILALIGTIAILWTVWRILTYINLAYLAQSTDKLPTT